MPEDWFQFLLSMVDRPAARHTRRKKPFDPKKKAARKAQKKARAINRGR